MVLPVGKSMEVAADPIGMYFLDRYSSNLTKLNFLSVLETWKNPFPMASKFVSAQTSVTSLKFNLILRLLTNHRDWKEYGKEGVLK